MSLTAGGRLSGSLERHPTLCGAVVPGFADCRWVPVVLCSSYAVFQLCCVPGWCCVVLQVAVVSSSGLLLCRFPGCCSAVFEVAVVLSSRLLFVSSVAANPPVSRRFSVNCPGCRSHGDRTPQHLAVEIGCVLADGRRSFMELRWPRGCRGPQNFGSARQRLRCLLWLH